MGNTFDYSDATDYSSKTHCNASSTGQEDAVKLASVQGKKVHDKFCFILNSNITNSNDTWGTSKHISKGDTSVTRLKNQQRNIPLKEMQVLHALRIQTSQILSF